MNKKNNKPQKEHLVNKDIPFRRLFVLDNDGTKMGEMGRDQAIQFAANKGFDLVIIGNDPKMPVAKVLDYGKFLYERNKKQKENKIKQSVTENKEVRLTAMIGIHDLETKARKARELLLEGARLKVSLKLRGREIQRQDLGHEKLKQFLDLLQDIAVVQKETTLNGGRFLDMYLIASKNKGQKEDSHAKNKNENKESSEKEN